MKNSELRKLISQYKEMVNKQKRKYVNSIKLFKSLKEIEQRYFHETGRTLKSDLEKIEEK
jgi:hypothetical protein|tara:strand:- start:13551 stop:13730 length:180 start_codon:yes stop_codon:yes gene_type:complete